MRRTAMPALARLLAVPTLAGVVLAGLLATPVIPASAQVSDPLYGAPVVGSCHDATFEQAYGEDLTVPTVPCASDHTLVTTLVLQLPADLDMTDLGEINRIITPCDTAANKLLGRNPLRRSLSLYAEFIFIPTAEQQAAGARWASCHLALWGTKKLYDLPTTVRKLTKKPPAAVALCVRRSKLLPCSEKHTFRSVTAFFVKAKGSDKAVDKQLNVQGPRACAKRVGNAGWATYLRFSPSKAIVICYRKTRK